MLKCRKNWMFVGEGKIFVETNWCANETHWYILVHHTWSLFVMSNILNCDNSYEYRNKKMKKKPLILTVIITGYVCILHKQKEKSYTHFDWYFLRFKNIFHAKRTFSLSLYTRRQFSAQLIVQFHGDELKASNVSVKCMKNTRQLHTAS